MQEESDLVTGEAVVLDLRVAKLASRGVAMALDVLVQGAFLLFVVVIIAVAAPTLDRSLLVALLLTVFVLVIIGYPVLFETLSRGRSLGKLALGLRVVRLDGGPIRFRHALTRALAGFFVDFWALGFLGAVAVIVSLSSSNGRRVGDYLAGTLVIRERVPRSAQAYVVMPPGLEGWAAQFDLSRLPDDLALAARQFLGRFHDLRPDAAGALGHSLAQQMGHTIGVPVPHGMPPWVFLSAVLAERRNRDHARLTQYAAPAYQAGFQQPMNLSAHTAAQPVHAVAQPVQPAHQPPPVPAPAQPQPAQPQPAQPQATQPQPAQPQTTQPPPPQPTEPENPFTLPS